MDRQIAQLILAEQQISYTVLDSELIVRSVYGNPETLWGGNHPGGSVGCWLYDLLPEAAGSEDLVQALLTGEQTHLRFDPVHRVDSQGRIGYVALVLRGFRLPGSAVDGLLVVAQDVTAQGIVQQELMQRHNELRLLQGRLERQNRELEVTNTELRLMNEIRSSFISVAAHELRTPLTSIYGFLELLQESAAQNLNSEQMEQLGWIEESAERLLTTLNELLDAARIDSDRLELVLRLTPVGEVIGGAVDEFGPRIAARHQRLSLDIPPGLPPALCDPARIEQVVGHLLSNASKFTPEGGTVSLAVRPSDSGDFLHITVSDQGQGIEDGEGDRLFQRFYRGQQVRKNGVSGVGLGLYITRSLVELHGGQIWYDSQPGLGSTFHVTVPAVDIPVNFDATPLAPLPCNCSATPP